MIWLLRGGVLTVIAVLVLMFPRGEGSALNPNLTSNVNGVAITFDPGAGVSKTEATDFKDTFDAAVATSATLKTAVMAGGTANVALGSTNALMFRIKKDARSVFIGHTKFNGNKRWIFVDIGDIQELQNDPVGQYWTSTSNPSITTLKNTLLTRVIIHEVFHVKGNIDPPSVFNPPDLLNVANENTVMTDLFPGTKRNNYTYFIYKGTVVHERVKFTAGGQTVTLELTKFRTNRCTAETAWLPTFDFDETVPMYGFAGQSGCSVGGIAELPEVAGTPLETDGSSGTSSGLLAGTVAAIAAGTVTLGGAAWYARRRWVR